MDRHHSPILLLPAVFCLVLCGCGAFHGVLSPTLASINPATVTAGGDQFTLDATGTNFVSGTILLWGGNALPTTVTSATRLTAKVNALQIASPGNVNIRAIKPDGTTSDAVIL